MFRPVVRLMQRLSYPTRFAVIGSVFAAALLFLSYASFRTTQDSVDFSARERLGVDYVRPLPALIAAVEVHRDLAVRAAAGDAGAKSALSEATSRVDVAWQGAQAVHTKLGDELGTGKAWQGASDSWQAVRGDTGAAPAVFARHGELADRLLALMVLACDQSNLTLDPDIDSYYLMDSVCVKLPTLMVRSGEARALTALALTAKAQEPALRTRLVEVRPLTADARGGLRGDLDKALGYNAALHGMFDAPLQALEGQLKAVADLVDAVLGEQYEVAPAAAAGAGDAALQGLDALTDTGIKQLDALLVARIDRVAAQRNLYVAIAVLAMIVSVYLFITLYQSITLQLGGEPFYVQEIVRQIADGRLDTRIQMDEDDRDSLLASIRAMRNQLRDTVAQLLDTAAQVDSAARHLSEASQQVATGSEQQTEAAASMAAAVEQLSTSISVSADRAQEARDLSREAAEQSAAGSTVIDSAARSMSGIARDVSTAAGTIAELGRQSEAISKVVDVIRGVAEQTNLLALNAAIEAARAGEQGRGFAVVADEVRKLAERATQSTAEIGDIVRTIQSTSRDAVAIMEASVQTVEAGQGHAQAAGNAIGGIREGAQRVVTTVNDIASALQEQSVASQSLAQNVERVAQMSEENSRSVRESAGAAHSLREMAGKLTELAQRFTV